MRARRPRSQAGGAALRARTVWSRSALASRRPWPPDSFLSSRFSALPARRATPASRQLRRVAHVRSLHWIEHGMSPDGEIVGAEAVQPSARPEEEDSSHLPLTDNDELSVV